jgi:hypothetical protein
MNIKTVTDYIDKNPYFRAAIVSHVAKMNRKKAKPENMRRSSDHYAKMSLKGVQARRSKADIEAGIIRAEIYQQAKEAGVKLDGLL